LLSWCWSSEPGRGQSREGWGGLKEEKAVELVLGKLQTGFRHFRNCCCHGEKVLLGIIHSNSKQTEVTQEAERKSQELSKKGNPFFLSRLFFWGVSTRG
jgi:hypothetical protein